ncbi:YbaK/EbsC family protein [Clostridium sp. DL1XJH146]
MSLESVKNYFTENNLDLKVIEFKESTATVELAAEALGVEPGQIAKTMAFRLKDRDILILSKGDARIDNKKFKEYFSTKAKMVKFEDVEEATGHPVGGVCPFGLIKPLDIYLDESLKQYEIVFPAGGSPNTAVKIEVEELAKITDGEWINLCKE